MEIERSEYNEFAQMVWDRENTIIRLKFELERQFLKNYIAGNTTPSEEMNMKKLNDELKQFAILEMATRLG